MSYHRLAITVAFLSVCACMLSGMAGASTRGFEPLGDPVEGLLVLVAISSGIAMFTALLLLIDRAEQRIVNRMKEKNDAEALVKALKSPWLGPKAALTLGDMGGEKALEPLLVALCDRQVELRKAAATALGNLGDDRAMEPLSRRLNDRYASVRESARQAMGMIKGRSNKLS